MRPKGKLKVTVTYKEKTLQLMYMLKKGWPPLFGREWLRRISLDWHTIKALHLVQTDNDSPHGATVRLSQLLNTHEKVFAEGIGTLKE